MPPPVPEEVSRGLQCRTSGHSGIIHMSFVPPRGMEVDDSTTAYLLDAQGNQPEGVSFVRERRRIRLEHPVRVNGPVTCVISWHSVTVSKSPENSGWVRGTIAPSEPVATVVPVDPDQPESPTSEAPGLIPVLHVVEDLAWLIAGG